MISQSTIQNVLDAARVEEVIGDFIQLRKSGSNFKGLSPFSDEKTPSFMVSPVKQIWKDFSSAVVDVVCCFHLLQWVKQGRIGIEEVMNFIIKLIVFPLAVFIELSK